MGDEFEEGAELPFDAGFPVADDVAAGVEFVLFAAGVVLETGEGGEVLLAELLAVHDLGVAAGEVLGGDGAGGGVELGAAAVVVFGLDAEGLGVEDEGVAGAVVREGAGVAEGGGQGLDVVAAGVGLDGGFDDLAFGELEGVSDASYAVEVGVGFGAIGVLAVEEAEGSHAVVAGAFEAGFDEVVKPGADVGGGVHEVDAEVAFVDEGGIGGVGAVEGEAVLRGLHVLEAEGNFGLAGADAVLLLFVDGEVEVEVADLTEVVVGAGGGDGEVGLEVHVDAGGDVAGDAEAGAAEGEVGIGADGAVALFAGEVGVGGVDGVGAGLDVAAEGVSFEPGFGADSGLFGFGF